MTPAQYITFKTAILADTNLTAFRAAGDLGSIAAYYNANGASNIWRPSISIGELNTAIVWSEFIALSQGQRDAYRSIVQGNIDATNSNIRTGFSAIFAGTSLTNLTALAQRIASRFELLFTTSQVCVLFGQVVQVSDVATALGS